MDLTTSHRPGAPPAEACPALPAASRAEAGDRVDGWRIAAGVSSLGQAQGSGLHARSYLVRRGDGQVVQLSELLYLVLCHLDPGTPTAEIADGISRDFGRQLSGEGLGHLVRTKLVPLGLVTEGETLAVPAPRAHPLLSLTLRGTLLPARLVETLSRGLTWCYLPPVVVTVAVAFVAMDVTLVREGDLQAAFAQLIGTPVMFLGILLALQVAAVVHEVGHAAACRYGGAAPGRIGFGVYLVYPAYFTDVTDSYRLARAGRLRTDLGGLYFNAGTVLVLGAGYLMTGRALLLLTVALLQVQMVQQLVPAVRFDGYYVLADLAGVPDLFHRVGPVLRSLLPGRPVDPRVTELRPYARRTVVAWVVLVVPLLGFCFGWLLWTLPFFLHQLAAGLREQWALLTRAWPAGDLSLVAVSVISMVLLVLPALGIVVLLGRLGALLLPAAVRAARRLHFDQEPVMTTEPTIQPTTEPTTGPTTGPGTEPGSGPPVVPGLEAYPGEDPGPAFARPQLGLGPAAPTLTAVDFTDANMMPEQKLAPDSGWRRAVHAATGGRLNPGPGAAQVRRLATEERLRAPIDGSRHVVVMSRKGGVGKTTMTLALGSTFSSLRGDRVVAVDANPDAGNLAHRVAPGNGRTITDVLADLDLITSYAQLRQYSTQAPHSRLEVLASDDDPSIGMALHREDYHRLIGLLDRFYNLLLLDTGTGILDSANQGLISEADQLVLVLRSGLDGGRAAALTLDWLDQHGYQDLVSRAVVVINAVRPGAGAPIEPMQEHFERRCRHVLSVPWDQALEAGAQTEIERLQRATRDALVAVAAAVADNFREEVHS